MTTFQDGSSVIPRTNTEATHTHSIHPENSREAQRRTETAAPAGAAEDCLDLEPPALPLVSASPEATLVTSPRAARLLACAAFAPTPALSAAAMAGRLAVAADNERRGAVPLDIGEGIGWDSGREGGAHGWKEGSAVLNFFKPWKRREEGCVNVKQPVGPACLWLIVLHVSDYPPAICFGFSPVVH